MSQHFTTGAAARLYGCPVWLMRQMFDRLDPAPARVGAYRVIDESQIPKLESLLRDAGRLPESKAVPA